MEAWRCRLITRVLLCVCMCVEIGGCGNGSHDNDKVVMGVCLSVCWACWVYGVIARCVPAWWADNQYTCQCASQLVGSTHRHALKQTSRHIQLSCPRPVRQCGSLQAHRPLGVAILTPTTDPFSPRSHNHSNTTNSQQQQYSAPLPLSAHLLALPECRIQPVSYRHELRATEKKNPVTFRDAWSHPSDPECPASLSAVKSASEAVPASAALAPPWPGNHTLRVGMARHDP